MAMIPRRENQLLALAQETVTIPLLDLYDLLTRRKDTPMPEFEKATSTTTKRVKRGYRRVSLLLKTNEYEFIARLAESQDRTPDQQAANLLRQKLAELDYERADAAQLRERELEDNGQVGADSFESSTPVG